MPCKHNSQVVTSVSLSHHLYISIYIYLHFHFYPMKKKEYFFRDLHAELFYICRCTLMYLVNWLIKHQCTFRISLCALLCPGSPVFTIVEDSHCMWKMPNTRQQVNWEIEFDSRSGHEYFQFCSQTLSNRCEYHGSAEITIINGCPVSQ